MYSITGADGGIENKVGMFKRHMHMCEDGMYMYSITKYLQFGTPDRNALTQQPDEFYDSGRDKDRTRLLLARGRGKRDVSSLIHFFN